MGSGYKKRPEGNFISHIHESSAKTKFEIVIRSPEEADKMEKCEIYGDEAIGLKTQELERLLEENPLKRFIPFKDT